MNQEHTLAENPLFLLGMPRSGTTWLSQIFESHPAVCMRFSPNYSYAFKNSISVDADRDVWLEHLSAAIYSKDEFVTHEYRRRSGDLPRFDDLKQPARLLCVKDTRFHYEFLRCFDVVSGSRIVYIVRDPREAILSWWRCKEFAACDKLENVWLDGGSRKHEGTGEFWGVRDWIALTKRYQDLSFELPHRVIVVKYEDLVRKPFAQTGRMFAFAGLDVPDETQAFIRESTSQQVDGPYSVFRCGKKLNRWVDELPEDIADAIRDTVEQEGMGALLEIS